MKYQSFVIINLLGALYLISINLIAKGPKYRFPVRKDFQKCREKMIHLVMNIVVVGVSESM